MPEYRFYLVAPTRTSWLVGVISCESDERAIEYGRQYVEAPRSVEVWEGRRLVASIKP
jgi:hypothetical protein